MMIRHLVELVEMRKDRYFRNDRYKPFPDFTVSTYIVCVKFTVGFHTHGPTRRRPREEKRGSEKGEHGSALILPLGCFALPSVRFEYSP